MLHDTKRGFRPWRGVLTSILLLCAATNTGSGQDAGVVDLRRQIDELRSRVESLRNWPAVSSRIRLFFPELTETDVDTLDEAERNLVPFAGKPSPTSYQRSSSPAMATPHVVSSDGDFNRYYAAPGVEVSIDPSLAPPRLELGDTDTLHPYARLLDGSYPEGADFYFEFDTSPGFDSPNFWRQPALIPQTFPPDLTGRAGLGYDLFLSHIRSVTNAPSARFPFRVTAMALNVGWNALDFETLAKFSQLLGYGLQEADLVREVFTLNRQRILYSYETTKRAPIDTFKAGLGECIHANELAGTMLELNGLRFRTVGGFNPTVRNIYPGGGHASIEVLRSDGTWEYMDPYLDAYASKTNAENFRERPLGSTVVFTVDKRKYRSGELPDAVTLADLFKYRIYSDSADRLPPATMLQLIGDEQAYGRDWSLRQIEPHETLDLDRDVPDRFKVYVRARYVVSRCKISHDVSCGDPEARASAWADASFDVRPIDLLRSR